MLKKKQIIIGNGFLANKFRKHLKLIKNKNITIYAAGISNSSENNEKELIREVKKFKKFSKENLNKVVYISTCSINDSSRFKNKYVKNKLIIENIIKKKFPYYLIIRFPEIVGYNKNPNTLTNFFFNKLISKQLFYLFKNTKRNLIDVEDAIKCSIKIINKEKKNKEIVNLLNTNFHTPQQIIKIFEELLNIKADFKIKLIKVSKWSKNNNFYFKTKKNYLKNILKKYYT